MHSVTFTLPEQLPAMEALLCQEGLNVTKTFVVQERSTIEDDGTCLYTHRGYVFYEWSKDRVIEESRRLKKLAGYAMTVRNNQDYLALKNAKQREMFLLAYHGLCSKDAEDVIELAKENMTTITNTMAQMEVATA